jgi:thiosulfate/3-mercaptopyruvate sulfurtransferase
MNIVAPAAFSSALISAAELAATLNNPHVRVIDATYGQPPSGMGIEKSVHFDIDRIADTSARLPHTIPSAEVFAEEVGKLGIGQDDHVVIYDQTGMAFAAARVWWMFRLFGHERVQVLDGGLPAWRAAGLPLVPRSAAPQPVFYTARPVPALYKTYADILANIEDDSFLLLDARDPRRFSGSLAEPRPGMPAGHIPGSRNVFFGSLINPDNGQLLPREMLRQAFAALESPLDRPVACTCGSGVTACVVALALHEIGHRNAAIYGGSWTEWATTPGSPVATGEDGA